MPLSDVDSFELEPLLREEEQEWLQHLSWDYSSSTAILKRLIDQKALSGFVTRLPGGMAGYAFYILEGSVGLIGSCYVRRRFMAKQLEPELLTRIVEVLQAKSSVRRIEAQIMNFRNWPLGAFFSRLKFQLFDRVFMIQKPLRMGEIRTIPGVRFSPWQSDSLEPAARLTWEAYQEAIDRRISYHYQTLDGCRRFLNGLVSRPGCGTLEGAGSICAWSDSDERLLGYVLASTISPGSGHIPQITVSSRYRQRGLGRQLLARANSEFSRRGYSSVSLTVSAKNVAAMGLYRSLNFVQHHSIQAAVWQRAS
ncbi:MAG: GNAT family N-acetyltransferase [Acidobacteriota bacterium]